jgi:hypothetical protein
MGLIDQPPRLDAGADILKTVETAAAIFRRGVSRATSGSLRSAVKAVPRDK